MRQSDGFRANLAAHIVQATDSATACREPTHAGTPVERSEPPLRPSWAAPCLTFAAVLLGGMALAWWLT